MASEFKGGTCVECLAEGVSFLLSIAGQGRSGESDVSERDEEILADEVDPIRGWRG